MERISYRCAVSGDESFLWEMLYQAIYIPVGQDPFPREIVQKPDIACYVKGWDCAREGGFIAIVDESPVGAAWLRFWSGEPRGFGFVDREIPELTVAVLPEYRGRGMGTHLILLLLDAVKHQVHAVSLSVSANNPALRLYQRLGFEIILPGESPTMLKKF